MKRKNKLSLAIVNAGIRNDFMKTRLKMRIIEIGCSTEGNTDGIGKHARIVCEEFNRRKNVTAKLVSGSTTGFSKIQMITSHEMCQAFKDTERIIEATKCNFVIVEYPFSEYNPMIIPAYEHLKIVCHRNNCQLGLSMHEFDRVNRLRRMVVRNFVENADFVYVSDPHYLDKLKNLNSNLYLRTIPNHIPVMDRVKDIKTKNNYVYFGLINRTKAFEEMVKAWDEFNKKRVFTLYVVTATNIDFKENEHNNIRVYNGLNNEDAAEIMWDSMFSIIPVNPEIGFNNSSFVSTIQCGCIPVGHFSTVLQRRPFVVNTESYDVEPFCDALIKTSKMDDKMLLVNSKEANEFGRQFTLKATVDMMLKAMEERSK